MCIINYNWKIVIKVIFVVILIIAIISETLSFQINQDEIHLKGPTLQFDNSYYQRDGHGISQSVQSQSSDFESSTNRGGLSLLLLGYAAKICFYLFTYFKLMCLCLFLSLLFILLCPLIPFLIPAFLLILVTGVTLAVTIPLISVAPTGGAGAGTGVTVVSTDGGGGPGPTPPFQAIPAVFTN